MRFACSHAGKMSPSPSMRAQFRARPFLISLVLVFAFGAPATAVLPYGKPPPAAPAGKYDYRSYLFIDDGNCSPKSAELPADLACSGSPSDPGEGGRGDWKYTDHRETPPHVHYDPSVANNPQEFYGVKGVGLNRAWEVSTGRPDVVIAVMDSGIRWDEDRDNLLRKHYLNRRELPMPQGGPNLNDTRFGGYDVNGDGFFNVTDYAADTRVANMNGNDDIDPEDLIRTFSDGTDADNNGYVDDISGWDFFENDNNPQDDTDYGHGTGEAVDSGGEAGLGGDGQCPNCMVMSMRVGDSFIADVNHWAEAVVYAVDNGASIVQEALGTLNHTSFGQAAADYAYRNGVIINASEADEAAGHHNWPAAYDHTMVVNSIRTSPPASGGPATKPNSYLYFNGCTNFGGYTFTSIPSTSCSSEATGRSSGVSGLVYSAAKNAVEAGNMTNYIRDDGTVAPFPLSAEEVMQLWRLAADDIDFSSSCAPPVVHDFCDDKPADVPAPEAPPNNYGTSIPASVRYQSAKGWDYFFGYGRNNAARLLRFIGRDGVKEYVPPGPYGVGNSPLTAQDRIPPEADISAPRRWHQYAYTPGTFNLLLPDDPSDPDAVVVRGRVAANRVTAQGGAFDWVLEWAPHVQGQKSTYPLFSSAAGSEEKSHGPWIPVPPPSGVVNTGRSTPYQGELGRINVSSLAAALAANPNPFDPATDPTSEFQPEKFAIRLRVRVIARPTNAADTVNNEAVMQKQIDVYPAAESVLRYDIGLDGKPSGGAGAPSFHDVNGDGVDEMLLATEDGVVHAYTNLATGAELPGWPVTTGRYPGWRTSGNNAYGTPGFGVRDARASILLGTLAAADLDDDGKLEVLAADLEGNLHVWGPNGTLRAGFPVGVDLSLSREPPCGPATIPACDDYATTTPSLPGTGIRDARNDRDWGFTSLPAVGDLDPDTPGLEIVAGSNDGHVYAWHEDGSPVRGWPVILRDPAKVAAMDPTTRHVRYVEGAGDRRGTKVIVTPSLGDIDGDKDLEVVLGVNEEYAEAPNAEAAGNVLLPVIQGLGQDPGNTRIYALHHDGAAHPVGASDVRADAATTPHTQDQAYLRGWPVPIAMAVTELLPYVGEGTNSQAVLADIKSPQDGDPQLEVVVTSMAGPGYVLNHNGSSFYGNGADGKYRTLSSAPFGPGSLATDSPSLVAVGALAIGSLDQGTHLTIAGPGAGLNRLLDIVVPAHQFQAEDHILGWNASTGQFEANFPITVNDLQFFTEPIIGETDGLPGAEIVQSTAMSDLVTAGLIRNNATATRYFTGGWGVTAAGLGSPPLGKVPDNKLHLAFVTREGWLRLIPTSVDEGTAAACSAVAEWPEYGHDARNSGNYHTDAERPYPVRNLQATPTLNGGVKLDFVATGDDRACGGAEGYRVRIIKGLRADPDWEDGGGEIAIPTEKQSGEPDSILYPAPPPGTYTFMVRADDDAGNGSAISSVTVTIPGRPSQGGSEGGEGGQPVPEGGAPTPGPRGVPVPPLCPGLEDVAGNHIVGTPGPDHLIGTPGRDVICGLGGDDKLTARRGNDLIVGGEGEDRIRGGRDSDVIQGGGDDDYLRGGPAPDVIDGGPARDRCRGGGGKDQLYACER